MSHGIILLKKYLVQLDTNMDMDMMMLMDMMTNMGQIYMVVTHKSIVMVMKVLQRKMMAITIDKMIDYLKFIYIYNANLLTI